MPLIVQCQACAASSELPQAWYYYKGPWRCERCHARHAIECNLGSLHTMRLEDRFAPGPVACSETVLPDVREAIAAYNAFAPRAAVVMVRRALERACREKGAVGNKLWEKIRDLHQRLGLFDAAHVALATATRHFGNFGAHPNDDELEDLTDEEARRALDIGLYLINKIFS